MASKEKLLKAMVRAAKEQPCTDCGIQYPFYVMQFDHVHPSEKEFNLSQGHRYSFDEVAAEIAKCEVVCANCHLERTHGRN